jgi:hypothetical protein
MLPSAAIVSQVSSKSSMNRVQSESSFPVTYKAGIFEAGDDLRGQRCRKKRMSRGGRSLVAQRGIAAVRHGSSADRSFARRPGFLLITDLFDWYCAARVVWLQSGPTEDAVEGCKALVEAVGRDLSGGRVLTNQRW